MILLQMLLRPLLRPFALQACALQTEVSFSSEMIAQKKVYFHRNQVLEHLYLAGCHLWCGPGWRQECPQPAGKLHQKKPVEQGRLRGRKAGELLETVFFLFS